ncbi:MAG: membrane protein insertion efficiency factor YidD [Trueperaceae bacterium]
MIVRLTQEILIAPLLFYRRFVSPLKPGPSCRFHPTCSAYAVESIRTHGPARGSYLALRRVLKCHPFHPGGLDPVPAESRPPTSSRQGPASGSRPEES